MSLETSPENLDDFPNTASITRSEEQEGVKRFREQMASEFRKRWYADYVKNRSTEELAALEQAFRESLQAQVDTQMILERMDKQGITGIVLGVFQHHLASLGIGPTKKEIDQHLDDLSRGDCA